MFLEKGVFQQSGSGLKVSALADELLADARVARGQVTKFLGESEVSGSSLFI